MRQREAHAVLRRFLKSAQGKGYRHVLVITGKGTEPDARRNFYADDARGVLRSAVPHWLTAPDLAHVVLSYAEAPRRLGGEGALYVRLRKPRQT
jgi:DNA-nicking Smr family endonuclease